MTQTAHQSYASKNPESYNLLTKFSLIVMSSSSYEGVIYCRVSSQEQVQGTSLDSQRKACLEYASNKGIKIEKIFIEKGESATAATRTEFLKALEYCRDNKGKISAFIVWKIDRFARNTTDHFAVRAKLIKYGVTLHSVTEPISQDPQGKLMETLLAGFAEFENEVRKQRCTAGMQARLRDGIWPWSPPIGYLQSKKRTDRRKLYPDEPDPERFPLLQRAFKTYMTGKYNITQLTDLMNQWGFRTRTGKPMFKQLTELILKDKFYAGIIVDPWTGEEYYGQHKPMITLEEYYKINHVKISLSNHAIRPRLAHHPDFPLRGFVYCTCGTKYTACWRQGRSKKYPYYVCNNRECKYYKLTIAKIALEGKFIKYLEGIRPDKRCIAIFQGAVLEAWKNQRMNAKDMRLHYEQKLRKLQERKEHLLQMRLNNEISRDEFVRMRDQLENEIISIEISKSETNINELNMEAAIEYAIQFIENPARLWLDTRDIRQQKRLQYLVFPKGIIYDKETGTYCTADLSLIFKLFEDFQGTESGLVAGVRLRLHQIVGNLREIQNFFENSYEKDELADAA